MKDRSGFTRRFMMRHRLYRFRRFTYTEYRVLPYGRVDGELYWDHRHSCSYYWTPLGVWLHPRKMRRVERELAELFAPAPQQEGR